MKRRLGSVLADCEASPKPHSSKQHYPLSARHHKKPRPLHPVIETPPSFGTPEEQVPTPDSIRLARPCDPLTAERKFAGISLNSPVMGLTENPAPASKGRRNELSRFSPAFASAAQQSPSFGVGLGQPAEDDDDDDDDGFCIISSQSYSRMSSQVAEPCNTPTEQIKQVNLLAQDSQETELTHFSFNGTQPASQPSQALSTHDDEAGPSAAAGLGSMAAAMAANITPELNDSTTATSIVEEGGTATNEEECSTAKMFPIFRPRSERKILVIIRHGESEYNKAAVEARALADPNIYDPKLTAAGHQQARALRAKLRELTDKHGEALWLTSPLTRCIETFLDACPHRDRLVPPSALSPSKKPLNVRVLSCIAEHVNSTGDIGRPPSALMKDFPMLVSELQQLEECWWFNNQERPNCAVNKVFGTRENKEQLKRRVDSFASWLGKRPEKLVIAFGHSTFWKTFTKDSARMKNGELKALRW